MSFNYTTAGTGKFILAGKVIARVNGYASIAATTYANDLNTLQTAFAAGSQSVVVGPTFNQYLSAQKQIVAFRKLIAKYVDLTFNTPDCLSALGINAGDDWKLALYRQMTLDSQSILQNTVTSGSTTAGSSNVGNGSLFVTKILDGVQNPSKRASANQYYAGRNSEIALNETIFGRVNSSGTQMQLEGGVDNGVFPFLTEGSGIGPSIPLLYADYNSKITNGSFDSFASSSSLNNWTSTGTYAQDSTNVIRPGSAVQVNAAASVTLSQAINSGVLKPYRAYCLQGFLKASSASGGGGTVTFGLTGTGLSLSYGSTFSQNVSGLGTSYTPFSAFIVMGSSIPSNIGVQVTAAPTGVNVWLDDFKIVDVNYFGGLGFVAVQGSTNFAPADFISLSPTNSQAGLFQTFWRQWYGSQLLSSGSPTISDSLVV